MHLFTNGTDTMIAESLEQAREDWAEYYGEDLEDYPVEEWWQVPDLAAIKIWCDVDGHPTEPQSEGSGVVSRMAFEWAEREPRGMLCSTEW